MEENTFLHKKTEKLEAEINLLKSKLIDCQKKENLSFNNPGYDFFKIFPEVIFEIDQNGQVSFVNDKAYDIFEYTKEDLENGLSIYDIISQESLGLAKRKVKEVFAGTHINEGRDYVVKTKTGKKFPVLIYTNPIILKGKAVGFRGVMVSISKLKKTEEELREAKYLAEQTYNVSRSAIFTVDNNRKVTSWNKRAEEITGYRKDDIVGKDCFFYGQSNCDQYCLLKITGSVNEKPKECTIQTKTGDTRIISKYSSYLRDDKGAIVGIIESFKDITEEKMAMYELIRAKEKAEEADNLKSTFLANMSHDLRTPINGILGFAELLRDHSLSFNERDEYLNIIKTSGNQLLNLINDIIDISKIEANQLTINEETLNVNNLLEELQILFRNEIEEQQKSIELNLVKTLRNEQGEIYTDPIRLQQILINLLTNAIKFTESGKIEFGYTIKGRDIIFHVSDTGRGISEEKLSFIFERFAQTNEDVQDMHLGTGLGLAICKGLVKLLEGNIWVDSKLGEGSTFYFKIPYIKIKSQKSKSPKNNDNMEHNWNDKTVLVVEDDPVNYKYIEILLRKTKARVLHAVDGAKAVNIFKNEKRIDLILMDIQLPIMSGYEATRKIKAINSEVVIVAQTANAMSEDREKCINAGCDDYITKPISPDFLYRKLDKIFKLNGLAVK